MELADKGKGQHQQRRINPDTIITFWKRQIYGIPIYYGSSIIVKQNIVLHVGKGEKKMSKRVAAKMYNPSRCGLRRKFYQPKMFYNVLQFSNLKYATK
jgi:hypothetical protein